MLALTNVKHHEPDEAPVYRLDLPGSERGQLGALAAREVLAAAALEEHLAGFRSTDLEDLAAVNLVYGIEPPGIVGGVQIFEEGDIHRVAGVGQ